MNDISAVVHCTGKPMVAWKAVFKSLKSCNRSVFICFCNSSSQSFFLRCSEKIFIFSQMSEKINSLFICNSVDNHVTWTGASEIFKRSSRGTDLFDRFWSFKQHHGFHMRVSFLKVWKKYALQSGKS